MLAVLICRDFQISDCLLWFQLFLGHLLLQRWELLLLARLEMAQKTERGNDSFSGLPCSAAPISDQGLIRLLFPHTFPLRAETYSPLCQSD